MERLVSLYRASTSAGALVALVVANLIPLVGVLFFGWDLWTILALYWAENGIIGLYNVARIVLAEGPFLGFEGGSARLTAGQARALGVLSKAGTTIFFVFHYGLFWFVHGIFVLVALPAFGELTLGGLAANPAGVSDATPIEVGIRARMDQVVVGAVALAISHGISFGTNFIGRGEYRRISSQVQMGAPYGRVVVLHLTIILGAMLSSLIGAPVGALLVLIVLKIALDLRFHLREHAGLRPVAEGSARIEA